MKIIKTMGYILICVFLMATDKHNPSGAPAWEELQREIAMNEKAVAELKSKGEGPKRHFVYALPKEMNMVQTGINVIPNRVHTRMYTPKDQYPYANDLFVETFVSYQAGPKEYYGSHITNICKLDNVKLNARVIAKDIMTSCLKKVCKLAEHEILEETKDYILYTHQIHECKGIDSHFAIGKVYDGPDGVYSLQYLDQIGSEKFHKPMLETLKKSNLVDNS